MPRFTSFCQSICSAKFPQVSVQCRALWKKYHFFHPNGMKFLWYLHMPKLSYSRNFQPNPTLHVSATSWSSFWTRICGCEATILTTGPNHFIFHRLIVLPTINPRDIMVISYLILVDHYFKPKIDTTNFHRPLPSTQSAFGWAITSMGL